MTCTSPLHLYLRSTYPAYVYSEDELHQLNKPKFQEWPGHYHIKVPCGKCLACQLDHANEWATRAWAEAQCWHDNCFITLTYNSARRDTKRKGGLDQEWNLPLTENGEITLWPKDVVRFMKRLRKEENGTDFWLNPITQKLEAPIRFLMCGEYGPKNGRPHYHLCLFNYKPKDLIFDKYNHHKQPLYKSKTLQKIWGHGFVTVGNLEYESACYVARYTQKKTGIINKKYKKIDVEEINEKTGEIKLKTKRKIIKIKGKPEQEYINMSRMPGIGLHYFNTHFQEIKRSSGILIKQKLKKIPKYFKKKWEKRDWEDYHKWRYQNIKIGKELWEKLLNGTYPQEIPLHIKEQWYLKRIKEHLEEINKTNKLPRDTQLYEDTC
jgi:hypothetical protein